MTNNIANRASGNLADYSLNDISDLYAYMPRKEVIYSINISLKNKYVYIENPKVACGHIKRSLQELDLRGTDIVVRNVHDRMESPLLMVYQLPVDQLLKVFNESGFLKFSFVRSPFTRTLSAYLDKIVRNQNHKRSILMALGRDPDDVGQFVSFKEFVRAISTLQPYQMDNHWRPQADQLFLPRIRYDFIGRFEHMGEDLGEILTKIAGRRLAAVDRDVSYRTNAATEITEYYDDEIADLVRTVYAKDFQSFGYSLELANNV